MADVYCSGVTSCTFLIIPSHATLYEILTAPCVFVNAVLVFEVLLQTALDSGRLFSYYSREVIFFNQVFGNSLLNERLRKIHRIGMSVFRTVFLRICLLIYVGWLLPGTPVHGQQSLRERFATFQQEERERNAINSTVGSDSQSRSSDSDEWIIPPKSGNRQPSVNQPVTNQPPVNQTLPTEPERIASSHRPDFVPQPFQPTVDWGANLQAARQSSHAMVDEATIRKALLGERHNDARLNDVCFATPMIGWAVGDCGVIWHTQNGGQNWQLQESGTDSPLFAVDFIDAHNGIAVGGTTEPYSHRGCGVVLRTSDGGQCWERLVTFAFPILYCLRIDEPGRLWVAGSASETCPTGILRTSDNGQTWQMQPGAKNEGWASLGFIDTNGGPNPNTKVGAGIGLDGAIQIVRDKPALSQTPPLGLRRAKAVDVFSPRSVAMQNHGMTQQVTSPYTGWLVGDGGVIMCSRNTGMTWEVPQGFLPIDRPDLFDFQTVFARDTNIWVAGNPGTMIFFSNDCGANWQAAPSGVATPVRKIRFITPQQGYAVGDLGTILATSDGGRSWQIQRAGGARLAVLGIFGRVQDVPYEAMAQLCLEEGYLGGVSIVFRQDSMRQDGSEIPAMRRLHEALVNCGGASSMQPWAFSLDHDELPGSLERILERLELENDGHGLARLREYLVATIRTWRPNIIITPGDVPDVKWHDSARDLLHREILFAVQAAANPMMYPEQLTEMRLQTWQVDKVHLCCNAIVRLGDEDAGQYHKTATAVGNILLNTQTLAPRYGKTFSKMAQTARSLFDTMPTLPSASIPFRTVFDVTALQQNRNPAELNRVSLMGLISLPTGSEARRAMQNLSMVMHYDTLQQGLVHQGTARGIIRSIGHGGKLGDANRVLPQLNGLTQSLDPETTVQTLLEMGNQLHQTGQWDAAEEVYTQLIGNYPTHVSTKAAYAWLLQYMCSFDEGERVGVRDVAANQINERISAPRIVTDEVIEQVSAMTGEIGLNSPGSQGNRRITDWSTGETKSFTQFGKVVPLLELVDKVAPDVLNDPRVRFCLAAAQIKNGEPQLAEGYYFKRSVPPNDDVWAVRAASELSAQSGQKRGTHLLPVISCRFTPERPFLDGKLDDDVWSQCTPTIFANTDATSKEPVEKTAARNYREQTNVRTQGLGSEVMFLYDREFLYIALRCKKTPGFAYRYQDFNSIPRTHDPNFSCEDHVELLLDLKRNYTTYDTFELDYRGWVSESRWSDKNWNPRWFVARYEDETHWYVEVAIPLDQLTDTKPKPGTIWNVALRRIIPGTGIDAWNVENSFNTREGFGYLVFE